MRRNQTFHSNRWRWSVAVDRRRSAHGRRPLRRRARSPLPVVPTLTSDYRFRGLSQTDKRLRHPGARAPSQHSSGFYVSFLGSSIDDYVENGGDAELDLIGGYRKKTISGTTLDGGVLYYVLSRLRRREFRLLRTLCQMSRTRSARCRREDRRQFLVEAARRSGIPNTPGNSGREAAPMSMASFRRRYQRPPITLTGHLGHSFVRNYITFGDALYGLQPDRGLYDGSQLTLQRRLCRYRQDRSFSYPAGGGRDQATSRRADSWAPMAVRVLMPGGCLRDSR